MLYNDCLAQSSATGNANTPATLWTSTVNGGSINTGNAMLVHVEASNAGDPSVTSTLAVKLNGVTLFSTDVAGTVSPLIADLRVTRTGPTTATVSGSMSLGSVSAVLAPTGVGGLSWGSAQALTVSGQSNEVGGLIVQTAGVVR